MLKLNRSDCENLKITDPYSIHRVVYDLFPGDKRDFLFLDKGGDFNSRHILILSEREPVNNLKLELDSKKISENFLECESYGFEICLNPTKREKKSGKIIAVTGKDNLHKWFLEKAPGLGFTVDSEGLEVRHAGVQKIKLKEGNVATYNTAVFLGKLKVTDREKFKNSFRNGIGRAKTFGFGLLQIVPL